MDFADLFRQEQNLVTVPAGHPVFRAGEKDGVMYVLMQGSADILIGDTIVESAGPGTLLGEMALIDEGQRTATVMARTECRLVAIDNKRFHFLIQQTPHFATHVMHIMADRLRRMDSKFLRAATAKKSK